MNNDYQIEDMENAAVNKSQTAKRVLLATGGVAAGVGVAFAAKLAVDHNRELSDEEELDVDAIVGAGKAGELDEEAAPEAPEAAPQPQTVVEEHVHYHVHQAPKAPEPEPEETVEIETTTVVYDEDGNPAFIIDEGTVDGRKFAVVDQDLDGRGDVILIDYNGDGKLSPSEATELGPDQAYEMGKGKLLVEMTSEGEVMSVQPNPIYGDEMAIEPDPMGRDDLDDIDNDFNQRAGERYKDDLAENNPDYNNRGNMGHYSAENENVTGEEEGINIYPDDPNLPDQTYAYNEQGTGDMDMEEVTFDEVDGGEAYTAEVSAGMEQSEDIIDPTDMSFETREPYAIEEPENLMATQQSEPDEMVNYAQAEPSYEEPSYEEPSYEEPSYEEPSYEAPSYEPDQTDSMDFGGGDDVII